MVELLSSSSTSTQHSIRLTWIKWQVTGNWCITSHHTRYSQVNVRTILYRDIYIEKAEWVVNFKFRKWILYYYVLSWDNLRKGAFHFDLKIVQIYCHCSVWKISVWIQGDNLFYRTTIVRYSYEYLTLELFK